MYYLKEYPWNEYMTLQNMKEDFMCLNQISASFLQ